MRAPGIAVRDRVDPPWLPQLREAATPKEWSIVIAALLKAAQGGDMDAIELMAKYLMPDEDL